MKVLIELRPALDGHSGIPQETRLLFRGLSTMAGIEAIGMIQSSNLVIEPGLPTDRGKPAGSLSSERRIDLLSRVVVSLQQGPASHRLEHLRRRFLRLAGPPLAALGSLFGGMVPLGTFEPRHFKDFLWRSMFAKSLPGADMDLVTNREFRVLRWPWSLLHAVGVVSRLLGHALYPRLDTAGLDVVVVETPFPGRLRKPTEMIVRYHDAIPLLMPHTIKDRSYHRAAHFNALVRNARDGAWFACVSEATRMDLLSVLPELEPRAVTIPNMVSHHFFDETSSIERVGEVVWSRKNRGAPHEGGVAVRSEDLREGGLQYLLMVCTFEPRKNHLALLDAWEMLRAGAFAHLNLVLVGSFGWDHAAILARCSPWLGRGGLHLLEAVPADDLRLLYRHARVTVCPSFGEGFDFPGIEAMRCGGVVAASDIRVHHDVFGDACVYFDPYSPADLARALIPLLGPDSSAPRRALVEAGAVVSAQYLPERVLPQWSELLKRVANG